MNAVIGGAISGLVATVPMTMAMNAMHRRLPPEEQYPLPPRLITEELAEKSGLDEVADGHDVDVATNVGHYGYGAACGAVYGLVAPHVQQHPVASGIGFGLLVWTGSYLGLLPALKILTPATEHPPERNALMIAAHVVFGAALGAMTAAVTDNESRSKTHRRWNR